MSSFRALLSFALLAHTLLGCDQNKGESKFNERDVGIFFGKDPDRYVNLAKVVGFFVNRAYLSALVGEPTDSIILPGRECELPQSAKQTYGELNAVAAWKQPCNSFTIVSSIEQLRDQLLIFEFQANSASRDVCLNLSKLIGDTNFAKRHLIRPDRAQALLQYYQGLYRRESGSESLKLYGWPYLDNWIDPQPGARPLDDVVGAAKWLSLVLPTECSVVEEAQRLRILLQRSR